MSPQTPRKASAPLPETRDYEIVEPTDPEFNPPPYPDEQEYLQKQHHHHAKKYLSDDPKSYPSHHSTDPSITTISPEKKCRDPVFAALFIAQWIALIIVGFWAFSKHKMSPNGSANQGSITNTMWVIITIDVLVASILSYGLLLVTKASPKFMIWAGLILGIAIAALGFIVAVAVGSVVGIIFSLIFLVLQCWYVYVVRSRIPFTAMLLEITIQSIQVYPGSFGVVLFGCLLQIGWTFLFALTGGGILYELEGSNVSKGAAGFVYFLLAVSFYWTSEVVKNIVFTTICGVTGTWYFQYPVANPKNVTLNSLGRATTYSFGSICFGSLIVAIVRAARLMLHAAASQARQNQDNIAIVIVIACAQCLLGCIEAILEYFNSYAYVHIALYGDDYLSAAKKTWALFLGRGFDAIINDSLVGGVTAVIEIATGVGMCLISGALAWGWGIEQWGVWVGVGFVIGFFMARVVTAVLEAAVQTLFVALAEDPAALANTKPQEYQRIYGPFKQRGVDLNQLPNPHGAHQQASAV